MKLRIPHLHEWKRTGIYLLLTLCHTVICPAQTPLEVKEATVTRSDGRVRIVDRDLTVSEDPEYATGKGDFEIAICDAGVLYRIEKWGFPITRSNSQDHADR